MACAVSDKKRSLIFINILISCIASSMLMTALTTALPAVVNDFQIPLTWGHWLTSGFTLVMGITMPLAAFLVTRFPTKNLYLTGLGAIIAGLLLCAVAQDFPTMMVARCLQACGNGLTSPMSQIVILSIYPPEKRGTAMGWYGLSLGAAPAIAPPLAGIIVDTLGWRAIFWFVLIIMSASFIWAAFAFSNVLETKKKPFDVLSFAFSAVTFGGLSLGIGNISGYGITSLQVWPLLIISLITAILFVRRQFHSPQPFLDLRVFQNKNYTISVIAGMMVYAMMMATSMLLPQYIQNVRGYSATISGLVNLPGALLTATTGLLAGKFFNKIGIKKLFVAGIIAFLINQVGMATVTLNTPLLRVVAFHLCYSFGQGCLMMPLVTWGVQELKGDLTAHGTALVNSLRNVAGTIAAAVFVGVMTTVTKISVPSYGDAASNHGYNVAALSMLLLTTVLVILILFFMKPALHRVKAGKEN